MVQPDQENSGGDSQAAAASQPFIPSETVVPHLNMVCDELQLLGQPEVEAFKSVYIAIGQLERSGYCANLLLDDVFEQILTDFSPIFTVCISMANVLRDILKCNIDADRMLFRQLEDNDKALKLSIKGLRENMNKFVKKSTAANMALLAKCDLAIEQYKDNPKYEKIRTTAEYTKAAAYRNMGDGYRYFTEIDINNDEVKANAKKYYDLSLELAKNFLPKGINLQFLNTNLNAAVFRFDICQERQEAFDNLLQVFNDAKQIVYPLISEHGKSQGSPGYVTDNFHPMQLLFQVMDTNLREWSKTHGFPFDGSDQILYSGDSQDDDNEDDDTWLDSDKNSSQEAGGDAGESKDSTKEKLTENVKNIRI